MPAGLRYRPMRAGEETAVRDLALASFRAAVAPSYGPEGVRSFVGLLTATWLRRTAEADDAFVLVAAWDGAPAGVIAVTEASHVSLLFVAPDRQGEGLGRGLLREAVRLCRRRTPALAALTVSASPNAVRFYEAAGFRATGPEETEDGMRSLPMRKALAPAGAAA
jgi:GNAT superfamily N-acetyltransferase